MNFTFTNDEVSRFAEMSQDINRIHLDDEFAQARGFERRVVHGAAVLLKSIPDAALYKMTALWAAFRKPIYPDDECDAIFNNNTGTLRIAKAKATNGYIVYASGQVQREEKCIPTPFHCPKFTLSGKYPCHKIFQHTILECCSYIAGVIFPSILANMDVQFATTETYGGEIFWRAAKAPLPHDAKWQHIQVEFFSSNVLCALASLRTKEF